MNNKIEKNLNIYFQCIYKSYQNKDIEPLLDLLYAFVETYDDGLNRYYDVNGVDSELIRINKSVFIDTILDLFTKLVKNDEDYLLEDYVTMIYAYGAKWFDSVDFLYALIYPKDFYEINNEKFYSVFKTLASKYVTVKEHDQYDIPVQEYLDEYKKYYDNLEWMYVKDHPKKMYFNNIMSIVIAQLYKDEVPSNIMPSVTEYVFNNLDYIRDFLNINGIDNANDSIKLKEIFVSKILSDINENKKEIK